MIAITGATGQLGRLVIGALLNRIHPTALVALVRNPEKAWDLAAKGITVREADYTRPQTLAAALVGVDRLLLISSNEVGQRNAQHRAVISAAKTAGVGLMAYTSILHADRSILGLAVEHRDTESALVESGVPYVLLRNGWYNENRTSGVPAAISHGVVLGSAEQGRISSAARADYALAAAVVLTTENQAGRVYELAGDTAYTLEEFAQEIAAQSGKAVIYKDLPEQAYKEALLAAGLPDAFAALLADSDAGTAKGELFDDGKALSQLIGRGTTPVSETIGAALKAL